MRGDGSDDDIDPFDALMDITAGEFAALLEESETSDGGGGGDGGDKICRGGVPVVELGSMSGEEFARKFLVPRKPVIVRDPRGEVVPMHLSLEYLRDTYGARTVPLDVSGVDRYDVPLADFLRQIIDGGAGGSRGDGDEDDGGGGSESRDRIYGAGGSDRGGGGGGGGGVAEAPRSEGEEEKGVEVASRDEGDDGSSAQQRRRRTGSSHEVENTTGVGNGYGDGHRCGGDKIKAATTNRTVSASGPIAKHRQRRHLRHMYLRNLQMLEWFPEEAKALRLPDIFGPNMLHDRDKVGGTNRMGYEVVPRLSYSPKRADSDSDSISDSP